mgnify:CR=1 FL=1
MPVTTLSTGLTAPLVELERRLLAAQPQIEHWFRRQFAEHVPPFYGSVDLRNSGFKLAPVDMNLFPGGFNNLGRDALPLAVQAATMAIERSCCTARNLLLIPENHTRNTFYLKNVAALARILVQAGFHVRIGTLLPEITEPTTLELPNGHSLVLEPLVRTQYRLGLKDFDPCAILVNNDLSAGVPGILEDLQGQLLLPPLHAGWHVRRKSRHFQAYDEVCKRFGKLLGLDPAVLNASLDAHLPALNIHAPAHAPAAPAPQEAPAPVASPAQSSRPLDPRLIKGGLAVLALLVVAGLGYRTVTQGGSVSTPPLAAPAPQAALSIPSTEAPAPASLAAPSDVKSEPLKTEPAPVAAAKPAELKPPVAAPAESRQRRAEQQHPQHRLDGAVLTHTQVRDQKQQTQQKKRRELRK